jgi:hypothetical protein
LRSVVAQRLGGGLGLRQLGLRLGDLLFARGQRAGHLREVVEDGPELGRRALGQLRALALHQLLGGLFEERDVQARVGALAQPEQRQEAAHGAHDCAPGEVGDEGGTHARPDGQQRRDGESSCS